MAKLTVNLILASAWMVSFSVALLITLFSGQAHAGVVPAAGAAVICIVLFQVIVSLLVLDDCQTTECHTTTTTAPATKPPRTVTKNETATTVMCIVWGVIYNRSYKATQEGPKTYSS